MENVKSGFAKAGSYIASFFHSANSRPGFRAFLASILSIIIGLFLGFLVMLVLSPSHALEGLGALLSTAFSSNNNIADVLKRTTPMILSGLAIAFSFQLNLFNIGVTGQVTIGAFTSIVVGLSGANWFVCILVSILAGAIAGFIPGYLKAKFNVNEVLSGIMLNWIIYYMIGLISELAIPNSFKDTGRYLRIMPTAARLPSMGLDKALPGVSLGLIISILIAIIIFIVLNKTNFGMELKMSGSNKDAAKYAGVNQNRAIILSLTISGALGGLCGYMLYADPVSPARFYWDSGMQTLLTDGFDGISVSLIAQNSPFACIFSAFFLNVLDNAQNNLKLLSGGAYNKFYTDLITNIIIYVAALSSFFILVLRRINEKHSGNSFYEKFKDFVLCDLLKCHKAKPAEKAAVEEVPSSETAVSEEKPTEDSEKKASEEEGGNENVR